MQETIKPTQIDVTTLPAYIKFYLIHTPMNREPQIARLLQPIKNYT